MQIILSKKRQQKLKFKFTNIQLNHKKPINGTQRKPINTHLSKMATEQNNKVMEVLDYDNLEVSEDEIIHCTLIAISRMNENIDDIETLFCNVCLFGTTTDVYFMLKKQPYKHYTNDEEYLRKVMKIIMHRRILVNEDLVKNHQQLSEKEIQNFEYKKDNLLKNFILVSDFLNGFLN